MNGRAFTLIELVMVVLLLSLMAAVAIPNYMDFRADAKNSSVKAGFGVLRAALAIATAAIALREDPGVPTPKYPINTEIMNSSSDGVNTIFEAKFNSTHPVLNGTYILDPQGTGNSGTAVWPGAFICRGVPSNAWYPTGTVQRPNCFVDTSTTWDQAKVWLVSGDGYGAWQYNYTTGKIWAYSTRNEGTPCTEANVSGNSVPLKPTENCY